MKTVTVRTFDNYVTANIILSRMEQSGIRGYLADENSVTIYPALMNSIGGIKLNVEIEDSAEAMKLLKQFDDEYLRSAECPRCGANDITVFSKPVAENVVKAVFSWLFSKYADSIEHVYQCQQCGYESKTLPENKSAYN